MKKLALLLILALSLTACGSSTSTQAPASDSVETSEESSGNGATRETPLNIQFAHILPAAVRHSELIQEYADSINEKTGGGINITVFPGGQLGGETEMIEQCMMGSVGIVASSHGALSSWAPKLAIEDLPYMWSDSEHARAAYDGEYGEFMKNEIVNANLGLKPLGFIEWGDRMMTTNKKGISKPEDLAGMKIRVAESPMRIEVFEQYGAQPVVMNFNDVYAALQQGVIDGQENPLATIASASLWDVQEYLSLTGHFYTTLMINFNESVWNQLTAEEQAIITECTAELQTAAREATTQIQAELLAQCEEEGFTVVTEEEIDKEAFKDAAMPIYERWFDGVFGEELTQIYKDASGWEW